MRNVLKNKIKSIHMSQHSMRSYKNGKKKKEANTQLQKEAKEMEQTINELIKLTKKLQQQMVSKEEKHTEALDAKEQEIETKAEQMREMRLQYDKHIKQMEADSAQMHKLTQNQSEIVSLKEEKTKDIQLKESKQSEELRQKDDAIQSLNDQMHDKEQKRCQDIYRGENEKETQSMQNQSSLCLGCLLVVLVIIALILIVLALRSKTFYCIVDQLFDMFGVDPANYKTVSECMTR
eukprot:108922_1